ncbi:Spy0128 family protein [Hornefia butyriciproducens]|uniref:Spy0128 family protein n=1 Tax=Hornefia butyriciproducens TaxID=2652293 RepID=UPI002A91B56D|nr:FctA domain-containing protein [Hornefia butyriciproducens]MCI7412451.1 hypothetical protein [Clostridiales bacterium]MDY6211961.1 FctA domain-containing protein [Hornefia butyriciproducens]
MNFLKLQNRPSRLVTAVLVIVLTLVAGVSVCMADTDPNKVPDADLNRACTLTIQTIYHKTVDRAVPISGEELTLYKVANLKTKGGSAIYTSLPEFSSADINYDGMTAEQSESAAKALAELVKAKNLNGVKAVSDGAGNAAFTDLSHGMYLVLETGKTGNAKAYSQIEPYLIMVPGIERKNDVNTWKYDVVSEIKPVLVKNPVKPCRTEVRLKKKLSGKKLTKEMFRFRLRQVTADGKVMKDGMNKTVSNGKNGEIIFSLGFLKTGTYHFLISEINDGMKNVTYDKMKVKASVTVKENSDGTLRIDRIELGRDSTFNNAYKHKSFVQHIINTGDPMNLMLWVVVITAAAASLLEVWRRKRSRTSCIEKIN